MLRPYADALALPLADFRRQENSYRNNCVRVEELGTLAWTRLRLWSWPLFAVRPRDRMPFARRFRDPEFSVPERRGAAWKLPHRRRLIHSRLSPETHREFSAKKRCCKQRNGASDTYQSASAFIGSKCPARRNDCATNKSKRRIRSKSPSRSRNGLFDGGRLPHKRLGVADSCRLRRAG